MRERRKSGSRRRIYTILQRIGILDFAGKQISLSLILVTELSEYWKSGSLHTKIQKSEGQVHTYSSTKNL